MIILLLATLASTIFVSACLDRLAQPTKFTHPNKRCRGAWLPGIPFRLLAITFLFGCFLTLTGRSTGAGVLTVVIVGLLVLGSNLKRGLLGEPLLFSDAAVIKACFQHPRFYVSALTFPARIFVLLSIFLVTASIIVLFFIDIFYFINNKYSTFILRFIGISIALVSWLLLKLLGHIGLSHRLMPVPDCDRAIPVHGFLATTAMSWLQWEHQRRNILPSHPPLELKRGYDAPRIKRPIVVVVQCESFADPENFGIIGTAAPRLPNLERTCRTAQQHGRLYMSGFGAYTMRTEYGVLFGHDEDALGFRRFDPYLSVQSQYRDALPSRLSRAFDRRIFVHPHDLRFYGRDRLMPAAGFNEVLGDDAFTGAQICGPHISDHELGQRLTHLIGEAVQRNESTFIFAVSIENHGPWPEGISGYLEHLMHGDAMLGTIHGCLEQSGHPAVLAFYGDHRPAIPDAVTPNGERHTPYLVCEFGSHALLSNAERDMTPAALHHAIFEAALRAIDRTIS